MLVGIKYIFFLVSGVARPEIEPDLPDYWRTIYSLVLHIGSKSIKAKYELTKKEVKKVNEILVVFDDTFKAEYYMLSIVSIANGILYWIIIIFISGENKIV